MYTEGLALWQFSEVWREEAAMEVFSIRLNMTQVTNIGVSVLCTWQVLIKVVCLS